MSQVGFAPSFSIHTPDHKLGEGWTSVFTANDSEGKVNGSFERPPS